MRTLVSLRSIAAACLVASASQIPTASAQPPSPHGKHTTPSAQAKKTSAAAAAYMSGKQSLLGWHAPSTKTVARDAQGRPMLVLTTINRGESLSVGASNDDGGFDAVDLDHLAHLLRAAAGEEHPVDPRTLSLVYRIEVRFAAPEIRVVSGYRVPKPGSHSNHGKGRAIDLIVPGVADEEVARFAREIGFVGVGVYPTSQFVHVDIRPHSYFWVDYSGPHMKNRERGILGDLATKSDAAAAARGQAAIEPFIVGMDVEAAMRARGAAATSAPPEEDDEDD
jgi:uncharacterized protein YcbK (DUF882 family)